MLKANAYPRTLNTRERFALWQRIFGQALSAVGGSGSWEFIGNGVVDVEGTIFDLDGKVITGSVTPFTEALKNQLRRNGIRFRYVAKEGRYVPWDEY